MKKIYVVKQNNIKDCGPACLSSIIQYHGGYVPLEKIILDTNTTKLGTNALSLIEASLKYGFEGQGFLFEKENLINEKINLPAIFQIQDNNLLHFVVVYEINNKKVVLMDPAFGKKQMKLEEFLNYTTGRVIEFYPTNKIIYYDKVNKVIDLFKILLKKEVKTISIIFVLSILIVIFTIINGYYFKVSIDSFIFGYDFLKKLFILFFMITFFKFLFSKLRLYFENYLNKRIDAYLLKDYLKHIINLPSKVIQTRTTGEIVARINDLGNFKNLFSEIFISLTLDFILVIMLVPILIYISKTLFLITIIIFVLYVLTGLSFHKILYQKIMNNIKLNDRFTSVFIEKIAMINSIKNLSKESNAVKYIENSAALVLDDNFKLNKLNNTQNNIKNFINEFGLFFINTIGFILVYNNKLTIVDLVTYNSLVIFFLNPIKNIIDSMPKYNFIKASLDKLNEFMNIEINLDKTFQDLKHFDIKIKNASFSYNKLTNILNNVNLEIKEREHVLIKGKSGSGKSTICNLLVKNEVLISGSILIGDINIDDINTYTMKKNIMYVSQKELLYTDTIKNNIMFFRKKSLSEFDQICKLCCVDEIIDSKPLRYETIVSVDTNNLSGGEKQRVVLARALLNDFKILIIDEALSEVDIPTEIKIIKNIQKYFKDKTIIYISHKNLSQSFERTVYV